MTTGIKAPQKVPVENKTGTMLDYIDSEVKFPSEQQELINSTQDILNTYMQSRDVLSKYGEPTKYVDDKIKYRKKYLDKMLKDKKKYLLNNSLKSIMLAKKKK
jgi:hypothetical protein